MPKKRTRGKKGEGVKVDLTEALEVLSRDKDIDSNIIKEAIAEALIDTAKKKISPDLDLECEYDEDEEKFMLYQYKTVVEKVENEYTEISLEEARDIDPELTVGSDIGMPFEMNSRIDAYVARSYIFKKIREVERKKLYDEFKYRLGELITGTIKTIEGDYRAGAYVIDIGRTEAVLYSKDKPEKEVLRPGDQIQAIIHKVEENPKDGYIIKLSRKDPLFLIRLFEKEVPEIKDGIVEIKEAVRDPGGRAKVAVYSTDPDTDPVGACVGLKGQRVKNIVTELKGEKVDIVVWSPNEVKFACNAIAPAGVLQVVQDEANKVMDIIVPNEQLSLAIGKKGQNVKLASKLVGWELRIISEQDYQKIEEKGLELLSSLESLDKDDALALYKMGFKSLEDLVETDVDDYPLIPGLNEELILKIKEEAKEVLKNSDINLEREKKQLVEYYLENSSEYEDDDELENDEEQEEDEFVSPEEEVLSLPGVDEQIWIRLNVAGYYSLEDLIGTDQDIQDFAKKTKFSLVKSRQLLNAAKQKLRKKKKE